ncbi:hypothetical protein [Nannocystis pusilla]|uniref:hypothetical protein n=1 Tax=Nannocystis pusilla TaxID=889268 RepID=UPI003BF1FA86
MPLRSIFAGLLAAAQVPEPLPPASGAAIQWRSPASCPDRGALLRGIETRLGRSLRPGELGVDGVVTVHATPPLYRLTLRLRAGGPEERRTLAAATCAALTDATAVLAASAVAARAPGDPLVGQANAPAVPEPTGARPHGKPPGATPASGEPEGAGEPAGASTSPGEAVEEVTPSEPPAQNDPPVADREPGPADAPVSVPQTVEERALEPVEPAPPPDEPARRRALGGFVRVQGGPEYGALPGITGAVGLAAGLLWRRARLEVQGVWLAPRTADRAQGEVRASLAAAAIQGCARLGRGRVEVPVCGGLELGGMRGGARGVPDARTTTGLWLAVVAGAGVAVRLGARWSLTGALQLAGTLVGPDFQVIDPGPAVRLFAPAPVTGRLLVGVEVRLGDPR